MIKTTAVACAAALALGACGGSSYSSSSNTGSTKASSSKTSSSNAYGPKAPTSKPAASGSKSGSGSHEVELDDNYFKPATITGKPGSTVKLELKNEGQAEHSFTIDSQHVDKELDGGKDATVSVKIPTSGSVVFYCKYHKSLGMTGSLKAS